ncbi:MAG: CBS domain-containing protein [Candidatus Micrarchaeota archaeon]|nr:CBS domain-containing protein [Candidatus Micrarchaeota archaeon]
MRMDIKVGSCMTVGVFTLPADKTVFDAAKLLKKTMVGSIIVTRKGKASGIITERDIIHKVIAAGKNPRKVKLKSIMSKPLKVIKASDTIEAAAISLRNNRVKRLPVVDKEGRLVGIITEGDLLRVYPGIVDVISEMQELRQAKPNEYYTGVCEICGCFSEGLKRDEGKLKCDECIEEAEV